MPSQAQPAADGSWCLLLQIKLRWALCLCYIHTFSFLIPLIKSLHPSLLYAIQFHDLFLLINFVSKFYFSFRWRATTGEQCLKPQEDTSWKHDSWNNKIHQSTMLYSVHHWQSTGSYIRRKQHKLIINSSKVFFKHFNSITGSRLQYWKWVIKQ